MFVCVYFCVCLSVCLSVCLFERRNTCQLHRTRCSLRSIQCSVCDRRFIRIINERTNERYNERTNERTKEGTKERGGRERGKEGGSERGKEGEVGREGGRKRCNCAVVSKRTKRTQRTSTQLEYCPFLSICIIYLTTSDIPHFCPKHHFPRSTPIFITFHHFSAFLHFSTTSPNYRLFSPIFPLFITFHYFHYFPLFHPQLTIQYFSLFPSILPFHHLPLFTQFFPFSSNSPSIHPSIHRSSPHFSQFTTTFDQLSQLACLHSTAALSVPTLCCCSSLLLSLFVFIVRKVE